MSMSRRCELLLGCIWGRWRGRSLPNLFVQRRLMGFINNRDQYWLERIGNREMVGSGMNGLPMYADSDMFPFPAIRYKEPTAEVQALLAKQQCDWKLLSKEEKKQIYRSNFCQTFAEFNAPTGEWMATIGYALILCSAGVWLFIFVKYFLDHELPKSFSPSWKRAQLRRQIDLQVNPITGLASNWDYEKNDWKIKKWDTPENPFLVCEDDDNDDE